MTNMQNILPKVPVDSFRIGSDSVPTPPMEDNMKSQSYGLRIRNVADLTKNWLLALQDQ